MNHSLASQQWPITGRLDISVLEQRHMSQCVSLWIQTGGWVDSDECVMFVLSSSNALLEILPHWKLKFRETWAIQLNVFKVNAQTHDHPTWLLSEGLFMTLQKFSVLTECSFFFSIFFFPPKWKHVKSASFLQMPCKVCVAEQILTKISFGFMQNAAKIPEWWLQSKQRGWFSKIFC